MSRPNILIFIVDQLSETLLPEGPAEFLQVPNLRALATRSVRLVNTYTASPLARRHSAALMSGQLPSHTRVYDNAAEFAASMPAFAHHARLAQTFQRHPQRPICDRIADTPSFASTGGP